MRPAPPGSAEVPEAGVLVQLPWSPVSQALVLNATFEPICVVTARRALVLVLGDRAELLHSGERVFRSERIELPEPSVIRLCRYVRVPYQTRVSLNRRAVFARDGHRCQYCGAPAENIDHVLPRSRGGTHTWDNVVASCRPCNSRKEDRTPNEAGFVLRSTPVQPRERLWSLLAGGSLQADWQQYLGPGATVALSA
jgi:5-methylcytosine-specific restriction endonuclease McrA